MSQPAAYTPTHTFISDEAVVPGFPGAALDVELNNVKQTTDEVRANLEKIQRDDGALRNGIVTVESLSADVAAGNLPSASAWASGVSYARGAIVVHEYTVYQASVAHVSTDFASDSAAGKWELVSALPEGPAAWASVAAWGASTSYSANAPANVVTYDGETYVCSTSHTSGTFAADLAAGKWVKVAAKGDPGATGAGTGDVLGPATNTADYVPQWNGASSKTLKDGFAVSTFGKTLANSADAAAARTSLAVRDVLTATRTYYVRTDGSDSNTGLADTSGGAFLTIQKAIDTVALLDIGTYAVTIQVGNGTYTAGASVVGPWLGPATVTLQGDTTTPSNVVISTTNASCITVSRSGRLTVKGFKLATTTSGSGLNVANNGILAVAGAIEFGACATYQCTVSNGGQINFNTGYTISGGSIYHWFASSRGGIACTGRTVALSGTPAFSGNFAYASRTGVIECNANTFSGSATGSRYLVDGNGIIFTNGGGESYLPGGSAGSTSTGGQYV